MDPRLLQYYSRELQYIREMGGEFAGEYPKIAGRLGLETFAYRRRMKPNERPGRIA